MNIVEQITYLGTVITIYEEDSYFVFSLDNGKVDSQLVSLSKKEAIKEAKEVVDEILK